MASLTDLKKALTSAATTSSPTIKQRTPTDKEYCKGFETLLRGAEWKTYQDFIIPELCRLVDSKSKSCEEFSILEIGPGPRTVLGYLPLDLRRKITSYTAMEPNTLYATHLQESLRGTTGEVPFPSLRNQPRIHRTPFALNDNISSTLDSGLGSGVAKFDLIVFCHSIYGMASKSGCLTRALDLLVDDPTGTLAVFHRDGALDLGSLLCQEKISFPEGVASVPDSDEEINRFASFITGIEFEDTEGSSTVRSEWRDLCRSLSSSKLPGHVAFGSPNVMLTFTKHSLAFKELQKNFNSTVQQRQVKNCEASRHGLNLVVKPTSISQIQKCIELAQKSGSGLTVLGGGHSGHCVTPHCVAIDMSGFSQVHVIKSNFRKPEITFGQGTLVIAESGSTIGDIVKGSAEAGVIVPLGARPSVGAGLWLQGGIGHLARLHGLSCDAIVGAVIVSLESRQVHYVGIVPVQYRPEGATPAPNEAELLWAIKGAGTSMGVVLSVTFKTFKARPFSVHNQTLQLIDPTKALAEIEAFAKFAERLNRKTFADIYFQSNGDRLQLGFSLVAVQNSPEEMTALPFLRKNQTENEERFHVDGVGLFDTELYITMLPKGRDGKTSSFKGCVFLKGIGRTEVTRCLLGIMEMRPSDLCYLHIIQGGGAVKDMEPTATAFGCREWDFACVITGVWLRDQDGIADMQSTINWVYDSVGYLLPICEGVYGADLGPDPRDKPLAAFAFGPNGPRLNRLKQAFDPYEILRYGCPIPHQRVIVLITGEHGAGKDHLADFLVPAMTRCPHRRLTARKVSISDATKQEYAEANGVDFARLLNDRSCKEQHRVHMTEFFQEQVRLRPSLPEEHFLSLVNGNRDVDVLFITGMRDENPITTFTHLVPNTKLIEIRVEASEKKRKARRKLPGDAILPVSDGDLAPNTPPVRCPPTLILDNEQDGNESLEKFAVNQLFPFFNKDLNRLSGMIRCVRDFPKPKIAFQHVLGLVQQPGGLHLCTNLLQDSFPGAWTDVKAVACCEAGGFPFAAPLADRHQLQMILIRGQGKLPPPTKSVPRTASHVSSQTPDDVKEKRLEMEISAVPENGSVVVVDDVLASGETLCAVLQLLRETGVDSKRVTILVVAEFPIHRGRQLLLERGFGAVDVRSLLTFEGA
ncbi:hypothetical protein IQ07DRAFT_145620 [Pyrenochaeta sp. DS3sAY3a]|nr:hypothetical protein IQ07DRAFT_145620 [Pyrenochaeta sp. DS3sAY3a]